MNDSKMTRTTAVLLQLALAAPGLALAQTASQVFQFKVPYEGRSVPIGFRGSALGYETRASSGQILDLQYAILHALANWDGRYATEKNRDQSLLIKAGVQVAPLDRTAVVILNDKLGVIRTQRNFGVPDHANAHHPISLQQMAVKHRALIAEYAGSIKYTAPGAASYANGGAAPDAATRETLLHSLHDAIQALAALPAADDAGAKAAVASLNATLARFGKGDAVGAAAPRADAVNAALDVYDRELKTASADAAAHGRKLDLEDAATLRGRYSALFDGSRGPSVAIPNGAALTADLRLNATLNARTAQPAAVVPSPKAGGDGNSGDADGRKPGLFGMLGSLFKSFFGGLFRTVSRVVKAVVGGTLGVAKALLS
jgi:hypothetical protein